MIGAIGAIGEVFSGMSHRICSFHIEKIWRCIYLTSH
jgi:hypothetical protein